MDIDIYALMDSLDQEGDDDQTGADLVRDVVAEVDEMLRACGVDISGPNPFET